MSDMSSLDAILGKSKEQMKLYDWSGVTESLNGALKLLSEHESLKIVEIREQLGYGFFRAAMQADSVDEFKKRIRLSVESYEKAAELCKAESATGLYCKAMARYSDSWCVDHASRKKELLDDCWRLLKEAFASFEASDDWLGCRKTFRSLTFCLRDRDELEGDWNGRKQIAEEAIKYGQNTISMTSEGLGADELAWAYAMTSYSMANWLDFFDERRGELISLISSYAEKALKAAEKTEDAYLLFFTYNTLLANSVFIKPDWQAAWRCAEKILQQGEKSRDHYLMGIAYDIMGGGLSFEITTEEDPDQLKDKSTRVIQFEEKSISHFLLVCQYALVASSQVNIIESCIHSAEHETDLERKRVLLEQAVEVGLKGSEYAQLGGSAGYMVGVFHSLSKAMFFLSWTEQNLC